MKYNTKITPKFYNTLTRKIEEFKPQKDKIVKMYNCGPTIYYFAHVGNLRSYIFADILRRTLEFLGYKVIQVMNITDVGHLTSDDDLGEDKIMKGLRREQAKTKKKITVYDIINMYTEAFKKDMQKMNIKTPKYMPHASAHVDSMIKIIKGLVDKGYAYVTKHAVYFDVTKFKDYTKLSKQALSDKIVGARNEVKVDPGKKHPADFRLWQLDQPEHLMQWDSPWGKGFPGWHIECSAMSMEYLGETLDIHTGGIDHIPVHHTNEIAQSEAYTGKNFANFWMHNEFLTVDGGKMSKSLNNFYTVADLEAKGYSPMALRYFYLTAKYRSKLDFNFDALKNAKNSINKLNEFYNLARSVYVKSWFIKYGISKKSFEDLQNQFYKMFLPSTKGDIKQPTYLDLLQDAEFKTIKPQIVQFAKTLADDLNTPKALSVIWDMLKSQDIDLKDKLKVFVLVIHALGLRLQNEFSPLEDFASVSEFGQVEKILVLLEQREQARSRKDWNNADTVRDKISKLGYNVIDMKKEGSVVIPKLV